VADRITVFLADDNLIAREGVRALLALEPVTAKLGSGRQSMTDRVEALGGTREMTSAPESGTRIDARLPRLAPACRLTPAP
jgi:signal transduction histidine kinase